MIGKVAGAAAVTAVTPLNNVFSGTEEGNLSLKGNIRHSVSQWCYGDIPLEEFAVACKEIGIESIELLQEKDWATVQKHESNALLVMLPTGEFHRDSTELPIMKN